ncbi:metal ABC transporter permease, partial [Campylobacter concisus]
IFSIIFCFIGLVISFYFNLTGGASIILVASLCFFAFSFKFKSLRS